MANTTEDLGYSGSWHYTSAMGQAVITKKKRYQTFIGIEERYIQLAEVRSDRHFRTKKRSENEDYLK